MKKKIKFNEKSHTYKIGNKKLTSVTKFISQFFKPFNAREIARKLVNLPKYKGYRQKDLIAEWKADAEHGTRVHKLIELYIHSEARDLAKWSQAMDVLHPYLSSSDAELYPELIIGDDELGLAGTIDLLVVEPDGVTLIDWKTNKKITTEGYKGQKAFEPIEDLDDCSYEKYKLQLNVYAYLIRKIYKYEIKELAIVHLKEDGSTVYSFEYDEELVEKVLKKWQES